MNFWAYTAAVCGVLAMALAGLWLADAKLGASLALVVMAWGNLIQHAREARLLAACERLLQSDEVLWAGEGVGVTRHRSPYP